MESEDTVIKMIEGDYGTVLPIKILTEQELTANDKFSIKIYKEINAGPVVSKEFSNIQNNTIEFKLTEQESKKLAVGKYIYDLDWYQDGVFLKNIIAKERFIVKEKAGIVVNEN